MIRGIKEPRDALRARMIAKPKPIPNMLNPTPVSVAPIPQHAPNPAILKSVFAEVSAYTRPNFGTVAAASSHGNTTIPENE